MMIRLDTFINSNDFSGFFSISVQTIKLISRFRAQLDTFANGVYLFCYCLFIRMMPRINMGRSSAYMTGNVSAYCEYIYFCIFSFIYQYTWNIHPWFALSMPNPFFWRACGVYRIINSLTVLAIRQYYFFGVQDICWIELKPDPKQFFIVQRASSNVRV